VSQPLLSSCICSGGEPFSKKLPCGRSPWSFDKTVEQGLLRGVHWPQLIDNNYQWLKKKRNRKYTGKDEEILGARSYKPPKKSLKVDYRNDQFKKF
jgi:hypothetical protein